MSQLPSAASSPQDNIRWWRLVVGLVLLAGLATFVWPRLVSSVTQRLTGQPETISLPTEVLSDNGAALPNRLVVLFVDGIEVGRTDALGTLYGAFFRNAARIGPEGLMIREGELSLLSRAEEAKAVAYAFPGDSAALPPVVRNCRLTLSVTGEFRCPEARPVPILATVLMSALLFLMVLPVTINTVSRVARWPSERGASQR